MWAGPSCAVSPATTSSYRRRASARSPISSSRAARFILVSRVSVWFGPSRAVYGRTRVCYHDCVKQKSTACAMFFKIWTWTENNMEAAGPI